MIGKAVPRGRRSHDGQRHRVGGAQRQPQLLLGVTGRGTAKKDSGVSVWERVGVGALCLCVGTADLKENLESCCRAVWLAESRRSSAEMFCRASSLDESWTPSSPQISVRGKQNEVQRSQPQELIPLVRAFFYFVHLLSRRKTVHPQRRRSGCSS